MVGNDDYSSSRNLYSTDIEAKIGVEDLNWVVSFSSLRLPRNDA
jgi:hypothetical protein